MPGRPVWVLWTAALPLLAGQPVFAGDGLDSYRRAPLTLSLHLDTGAYLLGHSADTRRQYAVKLARADRLDPAVAILEALLRQNGTGDPRVLHDLISVASWRSLHGRVLELAERVDTANAPAYTLAAMARSARVMEQPRLALVWYELAMARAPENPEIRLGLALTLADAGRHDDARTVFDSLDSDFLASSDGQLAEGYLLRAAGKHTLALLTYDRILAADADNREALRGRFLTLRDQLLPTQAIAVAARHPGIATRAEIEQLRTDEAAVMVRWGTATPWQGADRYRDVDRALARLQANAGRLPGGSAAARTTRFDTVVALADRRHFREAVLAYETLDARHDELPAYVTRAAASAYLGLRRPDTALALFQKAGVAGEDLAMSLERFYALVELERHEEAMALTDELLEREPVWHQLPGSRVIKPNPERLKAEIARALSRAYADQLGEAGTLLGTMLAEAPHNTDVRQELANVYRWRGWPRRSLFEYRQVLAVEPDLLSARVGHANTLLDLQQFRAAAAARDALMADHGDDPGVRRLVRRHTLGQRREVIIEAGTGKSTGEQFGSRQYEVDAWGYAQPFGYHWRPFVHLHDAFAEFTEGDAERRRAGVGLEYRRGPHQARAEILASVEGAARTGTALAYAWSVSDRWQLDARLETASHAMPLRGYRVDVSADRLRLALRYRQSELAHVSLAADTLDFSDGNLRNAWLLDARRRLLNRPAWKLDLAASLYGSRNDLSSVAYYSPESDFSASLGLDSRWRLYRRYDRQFLHRLAIYTGRYDQSGFEPGQTGSIEYEQIVNVNDALEFHLGIRRARALYDGNFEYGTFFTGGLRGTF